MIRVSGPLVALAVLLAMPSAVMAQRGMGDAQGVARSAVLPPLVDVAGTVSAVDIDTCAMTTGRAAMGAHVMLSTPDGGTLNLHLGPEVALPDLLAVLTPGAGLSGTAFRTDAMPADAFVAQAVTVGGDTFVLRDAKSLRPAWQIGPGGGGRGQGMGMGPGQGRGGDSGQGQGQGRGAANPAQGMGRCWW